MAFLKALDTSNLLDLMKAANYLDIRSVVDLTNKTMAERIKNKTPEEVRVIFSIENDFTPEEELGLRKDNEWAFEPDV